MVKGIVFDLDMTLVDSSAAEQARSSRNWSLTYSLISRFTQYHGFDVVFDRIRSEGIKVAIVSTAPGSYVKRVLAHFGIPYDCIVAYHDVRSRKPDPECMYRASEALGLSPGDMVSFGDRDIDILASASAGIPAFGCLWGSKEPASLRNRSALGQCGLISSPVEILNLL